MEILVELFPYALNKHLEKIATFLTYQCQDGNAGHDRENLLSPSTGQSSVTM